MDRFEYPNREGVLPAAGVTWTEAVEHCSHAGKRLCGVYEWEQACSADGQTFSMGGHYLKGGCALELTGPLPSGSMKTCTNNYGLSDMSGSVWEWTNASFEAPLLSAGLGQELTELAEIRGGSWMVEPQKGVCKPVDGYPVTSKNMGYEDVGFRCCRGDEWVPTNSGWGGGVCPLGMVGIGDFCIDQYEYPNQESQLPLGSMTFEGAKEACRQQNKRLCSEAEWTLACEGPDWKGYPYGSQYRSGNCASKDMAARTMISASGDHLECRTPDGVFDMTGNVWEWVYLDNADGGVLRGGGSILSAGLGRCRSRAFLSEEGTIAKDVGARCCSDVLQ